MDSSFEYGAHFGLRVLVLPVHPIKVAEYQKYLSLLKQRARIALADVPLSTPHSSVSSSIAPTPTTRGHLNLEFVEAWDYDLAWLEEFEIYRRVLAVVGILDCAEWANVPDGLSEGAACFKEQMQEPNRVPQGVFAKRCYAFSPSDGQSDNTEGLVVIPNVGDQAFYVHTLLAELASGILAGLSQTMTSLETRTYIATPREKPSHTENVANSYFPPVTSAASEAYVSSDRKANHTAKQPSSSTGSTMIQHSSRGASPQTFESTMFASPLQSVSKNRVATLASSGGSASASALPEAPDAKARKRQPARVAKLKGDLYCLAGRIGEGMNWCAEARTASLWVKPYRNLCDSVTMKLSRSQSQRVIPYGKLQQQKRAS